MPVGTPNDWIPPRLILVVEDDAELRALLVELLRPHATEVLGVGSGADALRACAVHTPDLVLLDLGLPDGDGSAVLQRFRGISAAPVIVLSGRESEADRVAVLEAGADDFVGKPCGAAELVARIRGHLRRAWQARQPGGARGVLHSGALEVDLALRRVRRGDLTLHLTPTEWALLRALALHAGQTVPTQRLWELVWAREYGDPSLHVRVHVTRLRRKVENDPNHPAVIVTVPGIGYRLEVTGPPTAA